jgi:hypothetical protein
VSECVVPVVNNQNQLLGVVNMGRGLVSKTDIMNIESETQEYIQQVRKFGNP